MRAGLVQLTSSDDPSRNLTLLTAAIREAVGRGARLVVTPEVSNCVSLSRRQQAAVLSREGEDPVLAGMRALAVELGVWILIGSLALKTSEARHANRSVLIAPDGDVAARYDKVHMFDVDLGKGEAYRESDGYRPGDRAVLCRVDDLVLGLTICYDLRFPALYRALAQAGATVLTVPSAFTVATGQAHWEVLLRARAIETGCFVLAPAQTGVHRAVAGAKQRTTYGHSMAVGPWGEVLIDMGTAPGVAVVDLDPAAVAAARARIPSLSGDRRFEPPAQHV